MTIRKQIYYPAGLISSVLLPFLCFWIGCRHLSHRSPFDVAFINQMRTDMACEAASAGESGLDMAYISTLPIYGSPFRH